MQQGTIETILNYYLGTEKFTEEIGRAENEFFNAPADGIVLTMDEKIKPYFLEWLIFDFRLNNGKSLIEDYYDCNPRKRSLYEIQVFKDLQNNVYGLVEVQKVYLGQGLDLLMLHTGEKYFVHEKSATFELKNHNLIFCRIAKIGDIYELVGTSSFVLPMHLDSRAKKSLLDKNIKYTPKDAVEFLKEGKAPIDSSVFNDIDDIDDIKADLDDLLDELGCGRMINSDLLQKWLANIDFKRSDTPLVDIVFGLSDHQPTKNEIDRIINLIMALVNRSPQKALRGKSPLEMAEKNKNEFGSKGFEATVRRIGGEWPDHLNKATKYLQKHQYNKALDCFEKTFKTMLKEENAFHHVFKLYANMAACYLYFGNEFMAKKMLDISLELNYNYEFGRKLLSELNSEQGAERLASSIRYNLKSARSKELKNFWKKAKDFSDKKLRQEYYELSLADCEEMWESDPARKYYDYLKKLEIDFSGAR